MCVVRGCHRIRATKDRGWTLAARGGWRYKGKWGCTRLLAQYNHAPESLLCLTKNTALSSHLATHSFRFSRMQGISDPNESTISSLAMSVSTVRPPAGSRVHAPSSTANPSIPSIKVAGDIVQQGIELEPSSDASYMSSSATYGVAMAQGLCFSGRVYANRPPLLCSANGLDLFFEYESSFPVTPTSQRQRRCTFIVEWLDEEEGRRLRAERPGTILNASGLSTAEDLVIPAREAILEFGSSIIRIRREE